MREQSGSNEQNSGRKNLMLGDSRSALAIEGQDDGHHAGIEAEMMGDFGWDGLGADKS